MTFHNQEYNDIGHILSKNIQKNRTSCTRIHIVIGKSTVTHKVSSLTYECSFRDENCDHPGSLSSTYKCEEIRAIAFIIMCCKLDSPYCEKDLDHHGLQMVT